MRLLGDDIPAFGDQPPCRCDETAGPARPRRYDANRVTRDELHGFTGGKTP